LGAKQDGTARRPRRGPRGPVWDGHDPGLLRHAPRRIVGDSNRLSIMIVARLPGLARCESCPVRRVLLPQAPLPKKVELLDDPFLTLRAGKESTASQTRAASNSDLVDTSIVMFGRRRGAAPSRPSVIAIIKEARAATERRIAPFTSRQTQERAKNQA